MSPDPAATSSLIATCPEETKDALAHELAQLGATEIEPGFRAVSFTATEQLFYDAHLRLRSASRILRPIRSFAAHNPAMLYSQARRIPWPELFLVQHSFRVEVLGGEHERLPPNQVITQVREAIRDVFERHGGSSPKVDPDDPKVIVVAHLARGRCTLSFDTCGKSLHKRGYRVSGHPAPLKETLAAAILILAGYDGTQAFLDPMCGSGTIAIEAARLALNVAPQILRKKGDFAFEWLKHFDRGLWRTTQERARAEKRDEPLAALVASDIEPKWVELAKRSAVDARVEDRMQFHVRRIQDAEPPAPTGILVANLPYGERLPGVDLAVLYEEIGNTLKQKFTGWRAALLAAEASPHQAIGLKTSRRIPILNGNIPCKLLIYDLYAGSKRKPRPPAPEPA